MKKLILFLLFLFAFSQIVTVAPAQRLINSEHLVLRGTVRNLKRLPDNSDRVEFEAELDIKFTNISSQPVIFLLPQNEAPAEVFRLEAVSLALSRLQAERYPYELDIYSLGRHTSIDTSQEYKDMAMRLDQPMPPANLTKTLQPQESWTWRTKCEILFKAQTKTRSEDSDLKLSFFGKKTGDNKKMVEILPGNAASPANELGWDVIGKIKTSLWMRLSFQVWSNNLQRADMDLRDRLQNRWKKSGNLVTADVLNTQAIEVKLYEFETEDAK